MVAQPVSVDGILSYAYRDGDEVHSVVQLEGLQLPAGPVVVRLRSGKRRFRRPATVVATGSGARLEFSAPAQRLGRAVWALAVLPEEGGPFVRVQARLLAHPKLPVALLAGPTPRTRLAEPQPRSRPGASTARRVLTVARRTAGRAKRSIRARTGS
jgi:hypothetical protein